MYCWSQGVFPVSRFCLVCRSDNTEIYAQGQDFEYMSSERAYHIRRCRTCGLLFLEDKPLISDIQKLYSDRYYTVNPQSPLYLKGLIYRTKLRGDLKRVVRLIKVYRCGSILECGCGNIQKLISLRKVFSRERLRLVGIDILLTREAKEAARQHDIELYEGDVSILDDYHHIGQFDLILMSQILEHLYQPAEALAVIKKHMNAKAKILIETPSPSGLDFILFRRRFWGGYHIPRHFYVFSRSSLGSLLEQIGFRTVKKGFMSSPGFWIISLRNALGLNSIKRSASPWEFISFHNLFVVSIFTFIDFVAKFLFLGTSNQFVVAENVSMSTERSSS